MGGYSCDSVGGEDTPAASTHLRLRWGGLFQLQMRISFLFLRAKHLRTPLLIMRTRIFFTLLYVGVKYASLVYIWYKNISA